MTLNTDNTEEDDEGIFIQVLDKEECRIRDKVILSEKIHRVISKRSSDYNSQMTSSQLNLRQFPNK